ncbi:hypothetical protein LTR66_016706 [Elasticomyces elasticus]|nr:hypothetical protein LTR66_016706 [Elasticomyces elasticus]
MELKKSNISHRVLPKGLGWCHQSNHIGPRAYAWLSEHGADLEVAGAWFENTINDKEVTPDMGKKLVSDYNRLLTVLDRHHWAITGGSSSIRKADETNVAEHNDETGIDDESDEASVAEHNDETGVDDQSDERARGDEGDPIVIKGSGNNELFVDQNLRDTVRNEAAAKGVNEPLSRSAESSLWGRAFLSGENYDCQNMTPTEASEFARWSGIHGESARQTTEELNMVYAVGSQDGDQKSKHDEESDHSNVDYLSSSEDSQRSN